MKETLEQTAAKFAPVEIGNESHNRGRDENSFAREAFITGAKWQQEHGQEVRHNDQVDLIQFLSMNIEFSSVHVRTAEYFLEQFKNNQL